MSGTGPAGAPDFSKILFLDLETYGEANLPEVGAYKYAETAEILMVSFALGDGPVSVAVWGDAGDTEKKDEFLRLFYDESILLCAHNAQFDRAVLLFQKFRQPGLWTCTPAGNPDRWIDTAAMARGLALPPYLAGLCEFFNLPADKAKDAAGKRLIRLFSMPQADGSRVLPASAPGEWAAFVSYGSQDVEAMRECYRRMLEITHAGEKAPGGSAFWEEWRRDLRMNDFGMGVDIELARRAAALCAEATETANRAAALETRGGVQTATQRQRMLAHLRHEYSVKLQDLRAPTVSKALERGDLPAGARRLLEAYSQASRTSTKKFETVVQAAGVGDRLRGCMLFYGASRTGRWSGRLFQPQNLPRGSMTPDEVETAIRAIKCGAAPVLYSDITETAASCLRGIIQAGDSDNVLVDADLSNIEGRVLAWIAGEEWKIRAFAAYDAGVGPDIYRASYARTFGGSPEDVTKSQRQVGKVMELALGYGGGVQAFAAFAEVYRLDLDALAAGWSGPRPDERYCPDGMSPEAAGFIQSIRDSWRAAHPRITAFWGDVERAFRWAAENPGRVFRAGRLAQRLLFRGDAGQTVAIRIPSGRYLFYPRVSVGHDITYFDAQTRGRAFTHGGKLAENITQAVARDILADAMARTEEVPGVRVAFSVHDELIVEARKSANFSDAALARIMSETPDWAQGLPLSAAGWTGPRYKKD